MAKDIGGYGSNPEYNTLLSGAEILAKQAAEAKRRIAEGVSHDAGYSELLDGTAIKEQEARRQELEARRLQEALYDYRMGSARDAELLDSLRGSNRLGDKTYGNGVYDLNLLKNDLDKLNQLEENAKLEEERVKKQAAIDAAKQEVAHATMIEDEMYRNRSTPSVEEVASLVIKGRLGNGRERIKNIKDLGLDPKAVQAKVNELMWRS